LTTAGSATAAAIDIVATAARPAIIFKETIGGKERKCGRRRKKKKKLRKKNKQIRKTQKKKKKTE
jgi:hypothetical protein